MSYDIGNLQAISILECMAIDMTDALQDLPESNPMYDVLVQRIEAINYAQKVLRNQKEEPCPSI